MAVIAKTGFIGGGKMAEAIISALISTKTLPAHSIFVSDISAERRRRLKRNYGINAYSRNKVVAAEAQIVFLAVKPQNLDEVLSEIAQELGGSHLVISIAAGKTLAFLEGHLPESRVIRVMPNLPCVIKCGMSVFCQGHLATATDVRTVEQLLACFGQVLQQPESALDAVTALSGSGPAFFAYLLQSMVEGGIALGLESQAAFTLALQTMRGTAQLMQEQKLEPAELIDSVTSPGGTTAAGRKVLEKSGISDILQQTLAAAAERSKELSS